MAGNQLNFLTIGRALLFFVPVYVVGVLCRYYEALLPVGLVHSLPFVFSGLGLVMVLKSFTERRQARMSWVLVVMNHCWIALAISFNEHFRFAEVAFYLSGVLVAGIVGWLYLSWLKGIEGNISLD